MALERRRMLSQCSERTASGDSPSLDALELMGFRGGEDSPSVVGGPSTPQLSAVGVATPSVAPAPDPSSPIPGPSGDTGAPKLHGSPPPLSLGTQHPSPAPTLPSFLFIPLLLSLSFLVDFLLFFFLLSFAFVCFFFFCVIVCLLGWGGAQDHLLVPLHWPRS